MPPHGSGTGDGSPDRNHSAGALSELYRCRFRTRIDLDSHDPGHGDVVHVVEGAAHSIDPDIHPATGNADHEGEPQLFDGVGAVSRAELQSHLAGPPAGWG